MHVKAVQSTLCRTSEFMVLMNVIAFSFSAADLQHFVTKNRHKPSPFRLV